MSDIDFLSGTPHKLKEVSISLLEKKIAAIVNELVEGSDDIKVDITTFEVTDHFNPNVLLKIKISQKLY